jgi:hypothetical protein
MGRADHGNEYFKMSDYKKKPIQTRQVSVTNSRTGETSMVDGLQSKSRQVPRSDQTLPQDLSATKSNYVEEDSSAAAVTPDNGSSQSTKKKISISEEKGKRRKIESCEEYLELYYSGKVKSLGDEIIRAIGPNTSLPPPKRAGLIEKVICADPTLEKTRGLLLLSLHVKTYSGLETSLRQFVRDVVGHHPVMVDQSVDVWFPGQNNEDTWNSVKEWDHFVSKKDISNYSDGGNGKDKKTIPAEIQKARRNAFLCACIWRYAVKLIKLPEFLRLMRNSLLRSTTDSINLDREVLTYLACTQDKDRSHVADYVRWSYEQAIQDKNLAEAYLKKNESLTREKEGLIADGERKDQKILTLNNDVRVLEERIATMEEEVRVLKVHNRDDLERQSSRTLRVLEDEMPVLTDCLTALNRDPPKVEVAKEYLATVLDTLTGELKILRED